MRLVTGPVADPSTPTGAPRAFYDAVFDLAAIPSGMDWRAVVGEIARLLRPGGRFYFTEVTAGAGDRAACRPTAGEFLDELARCGLDVAGGREVWLDGGYLLGVADRTG